MSTKLAQSTVDVLAFGAHPDDVEFACGGLLIKLACLGYTTAVVDMTQSELSTNGAVPLRMEEAERARQILGAQCRENLGLPDGFLSNSKAVQDQLIRTIRKYRPEMVVLPYYFDRHPDHEETPKLIRQALFTAGLVKYETGQQPHRPKYVFFYMLWYEFQPSLIVDITDVWERKRDALLAYRSQFANGSGALRTIDNNDDTLAYFEARARNYGFAISRRFGEPYFSISPLGVSNPFELVPNFF
jgi:bacillithiol biosynthesis deacetylase BshB1